MEQGLWIEILSRHRDVSSRIRLADREITIGRGYDNDVVIDDPYVAARHVRVYRGDGGRLTAEDLGSVNGMYVDRDNGRRQRIIIDGDKPIRIGQTFVRVREATYPVPPEHTGRPARASLTVAAVIAAVAILAIEVWSAWLNETTEPQLKDYLLPMLIVAGAIAVWVAVWSLITRLLAGTARFAHNLLIALAGILTFSLYNEIVQLAAFAVTWPVLLDLQYVAIWCVLGMICFMHLREIGRSHLLIKAAAITALFGGTIAVQTVLRQSEAFAATNQQTFRRLMPPMLRLVAPHDESKFFAELEDLKTKLDRDRADAQAVDGKR